MDYRPSNAVAAARADYPGPGPVIVVDDEAVVRELLTVWLQGAGYAVTSVACAEDALTALAREPAAVALCDIGLPGRDGLWLADRIRRGYPETAVIMSTGSHDVEPAVESLRNGVVDYLTKPFGRDRLREAVRRGLDWHACARDVRRCRESMEREVGTRQARLADAMAALPLDSDEAVEAMLAMVTIRDPEAYGHAHRVASLAGRIARMIGLPDPDVSRIERGALLHDLGKLAIPQVVLLKPAALTAEERRIVRMHPSIGSALVAAVPYLAGVAPIVRDAHERVDGLGFPTGSRGAEVEIGARVVAVADAFDSLTQTRTYQDPISATDALAEIQRWSGTRFDPRVVEALHTAMTVH